MSNTQVESSSDITQPVPVAEAAADGTAHQEPEPMAEGVQRSMRFWMVFVALCLAAFTAALDVTVITTALPTITREIGGAGQYVWIANGYVLTSTAIQPLYGQTSNIFGRRYPTILAVVLFLVGSGLSGGAVNVGMLIVGRCIQGLGSGGIMMMLDVIISDLVPLRDRPTYVGIQMSVSGVGATIGPLVGGAIVQTISWRWTFYINLPIGGAVLVAMILFLHTKTGRSPTWKHALMRVDLLGNAIFIASVIAVLLGLVMGGQVFPWSSWRIILPLVLGFVGLGAFFVHQGSRLAPEPTMPLKLFSNRTSAIAYGLTFLAAMVLQWTAYFLPVYFQGVLLSSPTRSGVQILPLNVCLIPFAVISGILITKTGKYVPVHLAGFGLMALGLGLCTMFDAHTSTARWVVFQIILAAGLGFTMNSPLPALQAALPDSYTATATATYAFLRSFAFVWGITIPAVIFNSQVTNHVDRIPDPAVRERLSGGDSLGFTTSAFLHTLDGDTLAQVREVFADALRISWYVALAFVLLGFLLCFGEKQIELRTTLDTEFGLDEGPETEKTEGEKA